MTNSSSEGYRLSPQQRDVWRQQQDSDSAGYGVHCSVQFSGALLPAEFSAALERVVERYEILRTTFKLPSGMSIPMQVIATSPALKLSHNTVENLTPSTRAAYIREAFETATVNPLSNSSSTVGFTLYSFSETDHVLLLSLPAMTADLVALQLLAQEICREYSSSGEADGEPMQYADIAEWQNELLEDENADSGVRFWRQQLSQEAASVDFLKYKAATHEPFLPDVVSLPIDAETSARVRDLVGELATSDEAFFLACWQVLLWRLTGMEEFLVGYLSDGRGYAELQDVLGLFARNLPLSCAVAPTNSVANIARNTQAQIEQANEQSEYFSADLGADAQGALRRGYLPTAFGFEDRTPRPASDTLSYDIVDFRQCLYRTDIKLVCARSGDDYSIEFHFQSAAFSKVDIKALAQNYQTLLLAAINDPQSHANKLPVTSARQRDDIIARFSSSPPLETPPVLVLEQFNAQVSKQPKAVAVTYRDGELTYGELNARANQLAHYLRDRQTGAETVVGLCVSRSHNLLIGIVGIMKAGGAYVPLDPGYPTERLAFILEDTGAPIVLTEAKLTEGLPKHPGENICLDSDWDEIAKEDRGQTPTAPDPNNLAYVIYTSGSTGRPKGVEVTHANLAYSTAARFAYYKAPPSCYLLLSSFAFDSSVAGIFWTLCSGGKLVLPDDGVERDVVEIAGLIERHAVTTMLCLPALYAMLLGQADVKALSNTQTVIVAGEECPGSLVQTHYSALPHVEMYNEYGPTEGTVWSSAHHCPRSIDAGSVPIGQPIPGTCILLLDEFQQPVSVGVVGELYIAGPGVARGYLRRPEITAQRFVDNPIAQVKHQRLYRTGDLGRFLPDQTIQFLGRLDDQVKIRGYRIELGEIEATLLEHTDVEQASAMAREDTPGEPRLVVYLVGVASESSVPALRALLLQKLPAYMVPSAFVFMRELPLNPNGKVDRKALPAPGMTARPAGVALVAPQTPLEHLIAEVWSQSIELEEIGIHDNFFELGGHSIMATRIIARLRSELRVEIPLRLLFEAPTIADLAQAMLNLPEDGERIAKTSKVLMQLRAMSDEEVARTLATRNSATGEEREQ